MPSLSAPVIGIYRSIPQSVRAVMLMMTAGIMLTSMNVSVKSIAGGIHPFEIAFWRHLFGVLMLLPMFLRPGGSTFRTTKFGLLSLRALLNVIAMLCYFLALTMEPLAKIVALNFTAPLFATLGAMVFLGERMSFRRALALSGGLSGALIVLRPWSVAISDGALLLLLSAVMWASALVVIKILSRTESAVTITLYASLLQVPFAFAAALFFWTWPTLHEFLMMAAIAAFGVGAQMALSQAFREADATVVLPADFTKLLFAGIAGWIFFSETPGIWIWVGGTVVFAGVFLNAWFDRQDRERARKVARSRETPQILAEKKETGA